jgi:soluble lytic murein transglycosylase-like protein
MKKILVILLIGLYFLSILSCSEQKIKSKIKINNIDTNINSYYKYKLVRQAKQRNHSYGGIPYLQRVSHNTRRINMLKLVQKAANRYNVEQSLICAIITQESGWKQKVISDAGAIGLMQIMPTTGSFACNLRRAELFNPSKNIDCGVRYFKRQLNRFNSIKLALCAYNAGPGKIKNGRCPKFKETQKYHKRIIADFKRGNACRKASNKFIKVLPFSPSFSDFRLSAKGRADRDFRKGRYSSAKQWWGLVCKNIDKVYYQNIGRTCCEPATTYKQKKLWRNIFAVTVEDIHRDELLKRRKAMSKRKIRNNIIEYCPKTTRTGYSKYKPVKQAKQQNQSYDSVPYRHTINNKRITMLNLVKKAAKRYNVKSSLICAIIKQESNWKPRVVSSAGAIGLMQIMPATGRSACNLKKNELFNPSKNINCGVRYFKKLLDQFNSIELALCANNAGPHRIIKYGKCPPFRETQGYKKNILASYYRGNACIY